MFGSGYDSNIQVLVRVPYFRQQLHSVYQVIKNLPATEEKY